MLPSIQGWLGMGYYMQREHGLEKRSDVVNSNPAKIKLRNLFCKRKEEEVAPLPCRSGKYSDDKHDGRKTIEQTSRVGSSKA